MSDMPAPAAGTAAGQSARLVLGCPECDLLVRLRPPAAGDSARCPRCGFVLTSGIRDGLVRPMAFSLASLVLMLIALGFPFLAVDAAGLQSAMTLATAVTSLTRFDANGIAVVFTVFVLLAPGAQMAAAAVLTALLLAGRPSHLLPPLARWLFRLDAWCMADVFAIGVIVSLVKLSTMAEVVLGAAFWAYLGFAVCFLLTVTSLDRLTVWNAIDALRGGR